jgi:hypothetical protein
VIGIVVAIWAALRQKKQKDHYPNPNNIPLQAGVIYQPVTINHENEYRYYG